MASRLQPPARAQYPSCHGPVPVVPSRSSTPSTGTAQSTHGQVVLRACGDVWRLSKFRGLASPLPTLPLGGRRASVRERRAGSRLTFTFLYIQPEPHRSLVCHVSPAVPVSLFRRARSDTPLRSPHRPRHLAKDGCRLRVVYRIHHIHRDLLGQVIGYLPVPAVRLSVCERPHESRSRARFCFTLLRLTTRLC